MAYTAASCRTTDISEHEFCYWWWWWCWWCESVWRHCSSSWASSAHQLGPVFIDEVSIMTDNEETYANGQHDLLLRHKNVAMIIQRWRLLLLDNHIVSQLLILWYF